MHMPPENQERELHQSLSTQLLPIPNTQNVHQASRVWKPLDLSRRAFVGIASVPPFFIIAAPCDKTIDFPSGIYSERRQCQPSKHAKTMKSYEIWRLVCDFIPFLSRSLRLHGLPRRVTWERGIRQLRAAAAHFRTSLAEPRSSWSTVFHHAVMSGCALPTRWKTASLIMGVFTCDGSGFWSWAAVHRGFPTEPGSLGPAMAPLAA